MKKKIAAIVLCAVMIGSLEGCGNSTAKESDNGEKTQTSSEDSSSEELEKITFVLDWTPNTNHTGLYVAQEKGYFEDAGLEVEIVQPPEDGATVMVATNKAQFGVGFQDTMTAALVGDSAMPIKTVAALIQHNTSGIVSRAGEGMDTPKGLEGKKYATWDLDVEKAMMKDVMEQDGGDFSKLELIPSTVTDELSALQSKSVDAIWIYYGWAGVAMEQADFATDYFAFKDINSVFDYYTPVIIANEDFLSEEPDTAKAFLSAVAKGYKDAIANPDEAADILCKAVPELDASLVKASQEWLADQYMAEVEQWGYIDPARWNAFYNWLNENNLVETELPENIGFTNEYLPE